MEIILGGKKGGIMLVSKCDYDELSKYKYSLSQNDYACTKIDGKSTLAHTYIMKSDYPKGEIVDHINGNRLDNRRENLRITTRQKNSENNKISKSKTSSIYHGVFYHKERDKYQARISINGKSKIGLGYYDNEIEAAEIRDAYIVQNEGNHIKLNFPEKIDLYTIRQKIVPTKKAINKTGFTGVKQDGSKYCAIVYIGKKQLFGGSFDTAEMAAKMYDKYIVDNNIANKKLNFPNENINYNPLSIIKTLSKEIDDKTIELNGGIIIDKDDYDKVKYYPIYVHKQSGYAMITVIKISRLHRFLMETTDPLVHVDHIDGNKLNNSKLNLRLSNAQLNSQNRKLIGKTSKFIGVSKTDNSYRSTIVKGGKTIFRVSNLNDEIVASMREIFLLDYLPNDHYKTNFKWTDGEKAEWVLKFKNAVDIGKVKIYN